MTTASPQICADSLIKDKSLGHFLYGLMSAFPLFFLPVLISLWLNLIQKHVEPSSLLASHLRWQKVSIMGLAVMLFAGYMSAGLWISLPLYLIAIAWFCYRVFKGWLSLNDGVKL
ncbi:hypothetical protein [Shewanella maritima]|uniref:hypothetical protein n=1 Tax=Shewanella maritima TaxID=2520507 RepID=UPI003735792C